MGATVMPNAPQFTRAAKMVLPRTERNSSRVPPAIESEDPGAASSYPRGSQPGQASWCREEGMLFQGLRNEREKAQPTLLRTNFHKVIKQARIFLYTVNLRGETNLK